MSDTPVSGDFHRKAVMYFEATAAPPPPPPPTPTVLPDPPPPLPPLPPQPYYSVGVIPPSLVFHLVDASDWSYTHTLPYYPDVRAIASNGDKVDPGINYPSPTQIDVTFFPPFTGELIVT